MRIGLIIVGVILLLIGAGSAVTGITTLGISGGHYVGNTQNITVGITNVVSVFGYAELGVGLFFALLGAYLLVVGLHSPDKIHKKRRR